MQSLLSVAVVIVAALLGAGVALWLQRSRRTALSLPREWQLMLRPVFTTYERHLYRQLVELFPQHVVLAKLPLTRFTQPSEPARAQYWHDLIAGLHVTFAVCSPAGRVLAAIDIEGPRGSSRRATAIKTAVMRACRVRYLCFMLDELPTLDALHQMVLGDAPAPATAPGTTAAAPAAARLDEARHSLADTVRRRREQRESRWQDSSFSHDSFFAPDSRLDAMADSGFLPSVPGAAPTAPAPAPAPRPGDIVGRLV